MRVQRSMLRITINREDDHVILKLEGKLVEPWLGELRHTWTEAKRSDPKTVVVDLRSVTFISDAGKAFLQRICRSGATFETAGTLNSSLVDQFKRFTRRTAMTRIKGHPRPL